LTWLLSTSTPLWQRRETINAPHQYAPMVLHFAWHRRFDS